MIHRKSVSLLMAALVAINATAITSFAIEDSNGMSSDTVNSVEKPDTPSNDNNANETTSDSKLTFDIDSDATPGTDISNSEDSKEGVEPPPGNSSGDINEPATGPDESQTEEPSEPIQGSGQDQDTPPSQGGDPDSSEKTPETPDEKDEGKNKNPSSSEDTDTPAPPADNTDKPSEPNPEQPEKPEGPSVSPDPDPAPIEPAPNPVPEPEPEAPEPVTPEEQPDTTITVEENKELPELLQPVEADENGDIQVEDQALVDFIFPSKIGDTELHCISETAFVGCPYFHSVTIPKEITEIGKDAFAECDGLEYIILAGRSNTDDMILGENWNGTAEIIFGLIEVSADTDHDTTEEKGPQEDTNSEADLTNDDNTESSSSATGDNSADENALPKPKEEVDLPPEPENTSTE